MSINLHYKNYLLQNKTPFRTMCVNVGGTYFCINLIVPHKFIFGHSCNMLSLLYCVLAVPKTESFQIKILIFFFIFLLKT